jgi:hypothetical protein
VCGFVGMAVYLSALVSLEYERSGKLMVMVTLKRAPVPCIGVLVLLSRMKYEVFMLSFFCRKSS